MSRQITRRDEIRERITARVGVNTITGCWLWTVPTSGETGWGAAYPRKSLSGQTVAVHFVMWTNERGFNPGKNELDHVRRNRLCVRPHPQHLELVTKKQNAIRREEAKRKIRCEEVVE